MRKFKNKYRISSHRYKEWNYSNSACYFLTINTKNHVKYFGNVVNGDVVLSEMGIIASQELLKSVDVRNEIAIGEYIVMPNHIHMLLILTNNSDQSDERKELMHSRQRKSISTFIGGYKSGTVCMIDDYIDEKLLCIPKFNRENPLWQTNYYDHIIRNELDYIEKKNYIINNPQNWEEDCYFLD